MKYTLFTILILASAISQAETVACSVQFGANNVERLINADESIQDVAGIQVSAKSIQACAMTCGTSLVIQVSIGDDLQFSQEAYARVQEKENSIQTAGVPGALIQGNYQGKRFLIHCAKPQIP